MAVEAYSLALFTRVLGWSNNDTQVFLAGVLLGLIYSITYQLCWSPLARFPGPRLWAISRIPGQLSVLRGYVHLDVTALHERYGPVVRVSPDELVFNTPQAFRDIYGARPGGCFAKDPSHYLPPANGVNHLVCEIDNASHARQRKLLAHAFSERALRDQESLITDYVDTMISKLRVEIQNGSTSIDIKNWMNYTTFDITGDLMFGESFGCLKNSTLHPWIDLIFKSIKALAFHGMARQFPVFHALLFALVPKRVKQKAVEHFDLAARRADRRLETKMARPDFMSAILQNGMSESKEPDRDGGEIMTRARIHSNAFILIIAGSETGATLLSGCIFYLCTNSRVMSDLAREIRSAFASADDITFRSSATLSYLAAVVEESLRMYPPFVTSLARIVPPNGATVDGQFVPGGVRSLHTCQNMLPH
ncbi:uncharacterized protein N7482_008738 [Penicillium canariense]|uniref:Cytochrome P450 n=1 Tax=Penicillium canariense TaxID=189055 RepID=A0A9W9HVT1_9EURO|nr:uncharacterized protein N7482_008738 [Penicillium canariense]KAJ5157638.1 hypothetical protein N7482_008738 [Penicillium canariense]